MSLQMSSRSSWIFRKSFWNPYQNSVFPLDRLSECERPRHPSRPQKLPGSPVDRYIRFRKMGRRQCQYLSTKKRRRGSTHLHLNLFENHLSYIKNLTVCTKKYQCATCDRHFSRTDNMKRHQKICKGQTKYRFPGGFYSTPKRYSIH